MENFNVTKKSVDNLISIGQSILFMSVVIAIVGGVFLLQAMRYGGLI
jgi:hypothetical protein